MTQTIESADSTAAAPATTDVAPLAWVIDEIRSSLAEALSGIKGFLGNKGDVDRLRGAGAQIHQITGALQLLDLRGVTLVTEAIEALLARWGSEPGECLPAAVRAVDATLGAVRNYLEGLLAGAQIPPIRLFPYYREILVLLRSPRVHPADLMFPDLHRRPPFHQMAVRALGADDLRIRRVTYEESLLRFLRDPDNAQARTRMRDAIAELEALPQRGLARNFWWVAHALLDALAAFQLPVEEDLKRFLARLNQQLRRQIEGGPAVAERLMIDALYHVGRADDRIERVAQVKQLYGLASLMPPDYERATLTTIDGEALASLKDALTQCKLQWGQLAANNPSDITRLRAEINRAQASAMRLGASAPARVLGCISQATAVLPTATAQVRDSLGMEVATALLLLETGVDGSLQTDTQFEQRADAMIERIARAARGEELPDAADWIAELARRAHQRSSMDTVVAEMATILREAELRLDRFFRNPAQRGELSELDSMLEQVGGVLGVLGYEDPAAALRNVRESVRKFADPATPPHAEEFPRVAQNLGAVGFFVDTLAQQPTKPRGMFHFDARTGVFSADMGFAPPTPKLDEGPIEPAPEHAAAAPTAPESENVERSIERLTATAIEAADKLVVNPNDAAAAKQLAPVLAQLLNDADLTDDAALRKRATEAKGYLEQIRKGGGSVPAKALQALLRPTVAAIPAPTAPMPASASAADDELHQIFIEEADEVLDSVGTQLARLRTEPEDSATLTMARRAFHTLKGSSRMVGLRDFGEFAWALEQCFNIWLAQERAANEDLIGLASASADRMRDWIEALRTEPAAHIDATAFIEAAHVVRDGGRFSMPHTPPKDAVVAASPSAAEPRAPAPAAEKPEQAAAAIAPAAASAAVPEDTRRIGPLVISHGLYTVFLTESDECIRALSQEIGEWRYESSRSVSADLVRRAHTLAGIADTVGLTPVSAIAEPLDSLMQQLFERSGRNDAMLSVSQFDVLERIVERMRGMLHQFAAGEYPDAAPLEAGAMRDLVAVVRAQAQASAGRTQAPPPADSGAAGAPAEAVFADTQPMRRDEPRGPAAAAPPAAVPPLPKPAAEPIVAVSAVRDEIDEQLLPIFAIEAQDLLPLIAKNLRALAQNPNQRDLGRELMRYLHTLKGSARMAGAMRLGELIHEMETRIDAAMQLASVPGVLIEDLQVQYDRALVMFEELQQAPGTETKPPAADTFQSEAPVAAGTGPARFAGADARAAAAPVPPVPPAPPAAMPLAGAAAPGEPARTTAPSAPFIRVRADVVDRLVDHAGEVSITRSKLEAEVSTLRSSLSDLTENIQRLRSQLREVELQADAQIQARSDQVAKQSSTFDPLEFDRYSRLQELTRLLAESVEDVALIQSNMVKGLQMADNDLSTQSRLTRELQQQLMRVRLVPFSNVSERLYRVARQAAKELGKRAHLDIIGGETEVDRSLLEQMAGPFEHLVRNSIVHGLEAPAQRVAAGKSDTGELRIEVRKEGNEVVVVFADDGTGLDLERIRARAVSAGVVAADRKLDERELIDLIFTPGLSTAREVTELAGRGIGMDVVREQAASLGGRVNVTTEKGRGTRFTLYLPMTLSIMQVVLASVGERRYALPAAMVEQARRIRAVELAEALQAGSIAFAGVGDVTLRPLSQLLGTGTVIGTADQYSVALLRLGEDRLAICADELSANQEVVVKNVGPQVARLAGVLGATVLGNGQVVLIVNPVQLIGRAPEPPTLDSAPAGGAPARPVPGHATLTTVPGATVMVVDDSLTVRRVTQRLLERNGYRTILAKDGVDAMRELEEHIPDVMLVDIEMPRMDGYDLTRNVRSNKATRHIPIIMITSRTAEKHRRVAIELGVNEYLGKPYREDELLELIRRYVQSSSVLRAANENA